MNKENIEKVIKKMLEQQHAITSVKKVDIEQGMLEEYYFNFPEGKYEWSITQNSEGRHSIFYYPSRDNHSEFVRFTWAELSQSAQQNLHTIYEILKGKEFGFDKVVEDILGSN